MFCGLFILMLVLLMRLLVTDLLFVGVELWVLLFCVWLLVVYVSAVAFDFVG